MAIARYNFETVAEDGADQLRVEDLERRALAEYPAVRERDDARGKGRREIQIVEHRANRELTTSTELAKELEYRKLVSRIQMDCRLVKEKHRGLLRERHSENGTLPFAPGEPVDAAPSKRFELELADGAIDRGHIIG